MTTINEIKEEFKDFIGTLILDYWHVARLLDIDEDEEDIYYKLFYPQRGIVLMSACSRIIPLKDRLKEDEYNEIERVWKLNINEIDENDKCIDTCKYFNQYDNPYDNIHNLYFCSNKKSDHFEHILLKEHLVCPCAEKK